MKSTPFLFVAQPLGEAGPLSKKSGLTIPDDTSHTGGRDDGTQGNIVHSVFGGVSLDEWGEQLFLWFLPRTVGCPRKSLSALVGVCSGELRSEIDARQIELHRGKSTHIPLSATAFSTRPIEEGSSSTERPSNVGASWNHLVDGRYPRRPFRENQRQNGLENRRWFRPGRPGTGMSWYINSQIIKESWETMKGTGWPWRSPIRGEASSVGLEP